MKSITLYNGYELIHDRNPYGSHSWMLRNEDEGDFFWCKGNVAVVNALKEMWPDDDIIKAISSSIYVGDVEAAAQEYSLGVQEKMLSIGLRCRDLQIQSGHIRLDLAYLGRLRPHARGRRRGARA